MILHTGLRTDIPAFYAPWLLRRLREGYVLVRSPYAPQTLTRYALSPEVVDLIAFCTKNPAPMLPHLDALEPYGQHWYVTITPYGRDVEPNVPPKEAVMDSFQRLSQALGPRRVGWRYDPILITAEYPLERHLADFEAMARTLCGYTDTCVISFIDLYQKVRKNFSEVREVTARERVRLGAELVRIGRRYGMTIRACAEGRELEPYGVDCSGCMTAAVYERALGGTLRLPKQRPGRTGCICYLSCDIGQYDTCGHLCRYCYANASASAVTRSMALHDPASPLLVGWPQPQDRVIHARQERWQAPAQMSLFD